MAGHALSPDARTAIIMPICNEDVATVFAGLRATCESVAATGHGQTFDVFVLSGQLRQRYCPRRTRRLGRPAHGTGCQPAAAAGCRCTTACASAAPTARQAMWPTSAAAGGDYRHMVVLDADSVMSGDCIVSMVSSWKPTLRQASSRRLRKPLPRHAARACSSSPRASPPPVHAGHAVPATG